MSTNQTFRTIQDITKDNLGSCDVCYMNPGTAEKKHYHDGIEIVYVLKGSCKTHKEGEVYVYEKGEVHEVINDSDSELALVCLTIPPESKDNTHYI